jgi:hypothetical protein
MLLLEIMILNKVPNALEVMGMICGLLGTIIIAVGK